MSTCESCGADDARLVAVHRCYLTAPGPNADGETRVLDEVERWCLACLTTYPHQVVDDEDGAEAED